MTIDQLHEQTFPALFKQQGLDGKLSQEEMVALFGISHQEMVAEVEEAARFLEGSPSREAMMTVYNTERGKDASAIMAKVNASRSTIDIGQLHGIRFTPPMWEVVKGCRVAGHFAKLDMLANFYAARWGNPADGTFSIDGHLNKAARSGCVVLLAALSGVIGIVIVFV